MNFNTTSLKQCSGSLVLIVACTLSAYAFAEDQTYTCSMTSGPIGGGSASTDKVYIQASSPEDAAIQIKNKYGSSKTMRVINVTSCTLKN